MAVVMVLGSPLGPVVVMQVVMVTLLKGPLVIVVVLELPVWVG